MTDIMFLENIPSREARKLPRNRLGNTLVASLHGAAKGALRPNPLRSTVPRGAQTRDLSEAPERDAFRKFLAILLKSQSLQSISGTHKQLWFKEMHCPEALGITPERFRQPPGGASQDAKANVPSASNSIDAFKRVI